MSRLLALLFVAVLMAAPAFANTPVPKATQALAVKSERVIIFFDADNNEIVRYRAAFGQAKGQKMREGDSKTPEGDYWMSPPRPSNEWGWFLPISYPNNDDIARAKKEGRDTRKLGGAIGLHPVGDGFLRNVRQSFGENWTLGCIAVSERAMGTIRAMVTEPILIRITP